VNDDGGGCGRGLVGGGEVTDPDDDDAELSPYNTDDQIDFCTNHSPHAICLSTLPP